MKNRKERIDLKRVARVYYCIKMIIDDYAHTNEQTREYIDVTLEGIVKRLYDEDEQKQQQ